MQDYITHLLDPKPLPITEGLLVGVLRVLFKHHFVPPAVSNQAPLSHSGIFNSRQIDTVDSYILDHGFSTRDTVIIPNPLHHFK